MREVSIRLERPATVTPELRAWISHRLGLGRAVLTRTRLEDGGSTLLLRIRLDGASARAREEEVGDLLTDLRLLGLSPTLLAGVEAAAAPSGTAASGV